MTSTELLAKIKAWIESRLKDYWKICFHDVKAYNEDSNVRELKELLSFLRTLESEKPMNQGLDKEIEEISIHVPCSEFTHESEYIDLLNWLKEQFTYFYELGCRRTAEKYDELEYNRQRAEEESVPKDLEEAADEYDTKGSIKDAFKAGWNAHKERMLKDDELHHSWKPSEIQIKALESCFCEFGEGCPDEDGLRSLYNDLKKLI